MPDSMNFGLQIVGMLVLPSVMILFAILDYARRRKSLSYSILSDTPLLSTDDEIAGRLQILFHSKLVKNVHLVQVKVLNSGSQEIRVEDYEEPIELQFDEGQVLIAETAEKKPADMRVDLQTEKNRVTLSPPHLLNGAEWMVIKMLVSHPLRNLGFHFQARIAGVKSIGESTEGRAKAFFIMSIGLFGLMFGLWATSLGGNLESTFIVAAPWDQVVRGVLTILARRPRSLSHARQTPDSSTRYESIRGTP